MPEFGAPSSKHMAAYSPGLASTPARPSPALGQISTASLSVTPRRTRIIREKK